MTRTPGNPGRRLVLDAETGGESVGLLKVTERDPRVDLEGRLQLGGGAVGLAGVGKHLGPAEVQQCVGCAESQRPVDVAEGFRGTAVQSSVPDITS